MKVSLGKFLKNAHRKISIEIDKFDTWGLDHTLALIILPALIQLKQTKHGVPGEFIDESCEDYSNQAVFDFMKEDKDEVFQKNCDKWEETLDKMIWSFQQIAYEDYEDKYHHGDLSLEWEKGESYTDPTTGKSSPTYRLKNTGEHWHDYVGAQMHEDRIQEGLDLFATYYRSLWD